MIRTGNPKKAHRAQGWRALTRSLVKTVIGSALLWSWGFLCFLSPALFPFGSDVETSTGLEYGFFASQAAVVVFTLVVIFVSKHHRIVLGKSTFLVAAVSISLTAAMIAWALRTGSFAAIVVCGIIDGLCVTLMGTAWGARYSLGSRSMRTSVVLSFLIAYLVYLVVAQMPSPLALAVICALPLLSWFLWASDASARHELSSDVFPVRSPDDGLDMPGELSAGSWEAQVLPWRSISVLVAASFIGNLVASVVMGHAYDSVESLFYGGIVVCACIATMALVPLTSDRATLSVSSVYRITLTFTAVGLVGIMVFGSAGIPVGGAFVQGSAFFLQVLVFLVITQSTQEQGLSPLLSFSVGQALIAAVVFTGNVLGKHIHELFGSGDMVLDIVCGCGLLGLFFMLVARVNSSEAPMDGSCAPSDIGDVGERPMIEGESQTGVEKSPDLSERVERFAAAYHLTKRETDVFCYLARGRSLPYIADVLFVTTGTVKTHTTHIYRKLDVSSRQELLDLLEAPDRPL